MQRRSFGSWAVAGFFVITVTLFASIVVAGSISLAISPRTEFAPGWGSSSALVQVVSYAWFNLLMGAFLWAPVAFAGLVLAWLISRRLGHSRAVVIAVALSAMVAVWLLTPVRDAWSLAYAVVTGTVIGVIVPRPGEGLEDLAGPWRGIIIGFAMFASLAVAAWHIRGGRTGEAGWTMCAASAVPVLFMASDLLRPDAPSENYVITAALLAVFVAGLIAIVVGARARDAPASA